MNLSTSGANGTTEAPRLQRVRHDLACGERIPCPVHGMLPGGYNPAERLRNGTIIAHDCGRSWRPWEMARLAA